MAKRVKESDVGLAALQVLAVKSTGEAEINELTRELPGYLDLSDEDRARSATRSNEEIWEQQVRNLVSHREAEGNVIAEGYADYIPKTHSLRITSAGRQHLKNKGLL